ncbi:exopolysaccharide biosynthesis polyprenyl glycosylphosphotransferase [Starkeya koreensis]|uniref:Exopolysaccharide biosynthesis polyprenyl glycosylphosphotransferase n=1 Tax=Ancylobacter koreensis TaxID=266121 RepID=A0ABT0DKX2_9HYPH|nr:exopolysaccharide biosynthesis polyprenyl glycosylphosphotransferase [Ancylobacter koreensis]MCK0207814.1 exopolysaccharide biosynthesis polyprenyl glycosylphosphotransferase [Ancylobacter koreensis]
MKTSLRQAVRLGVSCGAMVLDAVVILLACLIGEWIRFRALGTGDWLQTFILAFPVYFLTSLVLRGYALKTLLSVARSVFASISALLVSVAFSLAVVFALKISNEASRLATGYTLIVAILLLVIARSLLRWLMKYFFNAIVATRTLVMTDGLSSSNAAPDRFTRTLNVRTEGLVPAIRDPRFFGRLTGIVQDADRIVLSFDDPDERVEWSAVMQLSGFDAEIVADLGDVRPLDLSHWEGHTTLIISRRPLSTAERAAKRLFDLVVTLALMPAVLPILAVAAIAIRIDTPGPVFFLQPRVGRNNRAYRCIKLRTMHVHKLDTKGSASTARADARITRVGRFLRLTSIDELPQLLNVLAGEMSLVGPRPHALGSRAEEQLFWDVVPEYWSRHAMKPGITGLAQVRGLRGATECREDIEQRVAADLEYINGWSLWLDIKILAMTPRVIIHRNAY